MQETIRVLKARANTAYFEGMQSSQFAEHARAEYRRLARENREKFALSGRDAISADAVFGSYAVAKDCIETEQMHGRWATERLQVANTNFTKVNDLLGELTTFLRQRHQALLSPAPRQRSES